MKSWAFLHGLIPLLGGLYGLLMAHGILPRNPPDPEAMELWRRKFGTMMKWICPIIMFGGFVTILVGVLQQFGIITAFAPQ